MLLFQEPRSTRRLWVRMPKKYAAELDALAAARGARPKVHKTSRNFIARTAYDAVQIEYLFDFVAKPASGGSWGDWGEAFNKCCTVLLPDLDYCGYVGLSKEASPNRFQRHLSNKASRERRRTQGSIMEDMCSPVDVLSTGRTTCCCTTCSNCTAVLLLHHMFEIHSGEIVLVWKADRGLEDLADKLPSVRQELHRPQYYTLNTKEVDVKRNLANRYFTTKNKAVKGSASGDAKRFCWLLQLAIVGVGLKKLAACGALGVKKKQIAALWG